MSLSLSLFVAFWVLAPFAVVIALDRIRRRRLTKAERAKEDRETDRQARIY